MADIPREALLRGAWAIVAIAGLAVLYKDTFVWLSHIWWTDKEHSHGFLVPLVSLYLVWRKRELLARRSARPRPVAGGAVIVLSLLLFFAGRAGAFVLAEAVSFLILIPGIVLFIWGWERLKALAVPLAYLQFMVPWSEEFIDKIHPPFQYFSAWLGVAILKTSGIPVLLDGKHIFLPNITLEVAKECSGVRFLTSVVTLGLPLVYLTQTRWWKAICILCSGVVIAILANSLRIALAASMAYKFSTDLLHGPFHIFQGWVVAQVGFLALVVINWLVGRNLDPGTPALSESWRLAPEPSSPRAGGTGESCRRTAAVSVLVWGGAILSLGYMGPTPVPRESAGRSIPVSFAGWTGKDVEWIQGKEYFPGVDVQVARRYSDGNGAEVYFYSGYFEVQRQGKSVVNHHSNRLHESATWVRSHMENGPPAMEMSEFFVNGTRYRAFLWYQLGGRYPAGRYDMKIRTVLDSLVHRRNNASVFIVAASAGGPDRPMDWDSLRRFSEHVLKNSGSSPPQGSL